MLHFALDDNRQHEIAHSARALAHKEHGFVVAAVHHQLCEYIKMCVCVCVCVCVTKVLF